MQSWSSEESFDFSSDTIRIPPPLDSPAIISTERQFNHLQHEILRQGKEIEHFIQSYSGDHKQSELLTSLTTLFELFKSELAVNVALRDSILKQKRLSQPCDTTFLRTLSKASGLTISDFDQATQFVLNLIRDSQNRFSKDEERLQFSLDLAKATVRAEKYQTLNSELQQRLANLQSDLTLANTKLHQKKLKCHTLKTKLSEIEQIHSAELATTQLQFRAFEQHHLVDSSSQSSELQEEFENFIQNAKLRIAKLRRERNEARALIQNQAKIHNAALAKAAELETALQTLQKKIPQRYDSTHEHNLLSELHSLSKGVKALEKRNAQLTSLVNHYPPISISMNDHFQSFSDSKT